MRYRRGSALAALVAFAAAGAITTTSASAATVSSCPWWFYSNESMFQNANLGITSTPGEISNCRRITLDDDNYPTGSVAYQFIYRSQLESGASVPVSGTVIVPPTSATGIISLSTGTVGLADKIGDTDSCAPSAGLPTGSAFVSGVAAAYVNDGYAVAVTDYQGLRTPGNHLYLNGPAEGKAMIDVARAARKIPGAGLSGKKTLFTGYSQGGHATLWAAQLKGSYAPELPVVGAVSGAAPVDIDAVRQTISGALASGLMSYVITSLNNAYPELGLYGKLSSSGQSFVNDLSVKCSPSMALTLSGQFRTWDNLWKTGQNPLSDPAFNARVAQNGVPATTPTVPLFMFHGDNDGIVPIGPDQALANSWIAQGANVTWQTVSGSHLWFSNENGRNASAAWVAARFAQ